MNHFSPELVTWIKEYYKSHFDIDLSDEKAEEGLRDFAGLYEAMEELVKQD